MGRVVFLDDVQRLAVRALAGGGTFRTLDGGLTTLATIDWNVAGDCECPRTIEFGARPERGRPKPRLERSTWVIMETRCRKCPPCLKVRSNSWAYRAKLELSAAPRTWFGTLTLKPAEHYRARLKATARLHAGGVVFEELSPEEQFQERHREISKEITLWLKRVRKNSGAKLRYLIAVEAHKSGLPHYHILVHEVFGDSHVRKRQLQSVWRFGFSNFELVTGGSPAWYVCKYLSKSHEARVRASLGYGRMDPA